MDSTDDPTADGPVTKRRKTRDSSIPRTGSSGSPSPHRRQRSRSGSSHSTYNGVATSPSANSNNSNRTDDNNGNKYTSPSRSHAKASSRSRSQSFSRTPSESSPPPLQPQTSSRRSTRSSSTSSTTTTTTTSSDLAPRIQSFSPPRSRPDPFEPNYKAVFSLYGHTGPVSQVRISPNGRFIASASADATLRLWDAATGAHMDTLVGHMAGVSCLAWTPDSNTLASGSDDKAIRLWDRVTGRPKTTTRKLSVGGQDIAALRGHHSYIHCLAFSPKGNILASGSYDEAVFLWDVRAGRLMRSLPAHSDPVAGVDFSRDGTLVVSCSTDGLIRVWDTSTGQCLRTLVHEDNPAVTNVCFSPNGRFVLAFNLDSCIRLWDYVAGTVKKTYQGHKNENFAIGGCFGVLQGQAFIASASENGDVVLWDVKSKEILQRVPVGHKGVCFWVDVHGDKMVTAGQDHSIQVYKHDAGKVVTINGTASSDHDVEAQIRSEMPIRQDAIKLEDA